MKYEIRTKKQENPLNSFLKRNRSIIPRYRKSRGSQHSRCREPRLHFFWLREQSFDLKILVPLCALRQYAEQMKQIVIQPQAVGFCRFHQRINDCTRRCQYHIVITPKYRRQIIYGRYKVEIGKILRTICDRYEVEIIVANACPDHIHMLVAIPPKMSVSRFM